MAYDNTNRGILSRNDRRENDRQPEFKGSINIEGVEYWLSGWVKESARGKFFSLSVKAKEERATPAVSREPGSDDMPNDDVPF